MLQVIRASVPVCAAIFGVCIEHKIPSKAEVICLFVVSIGVMYGWPSHAPPFPNHPTSFWSLGPFHRLAVWEESRNAVLGIVLTLTSTVMQSIQAVAIPILIQLAMSPQQG